MAGPVSFRVQTPYRIVSYLIVSYRSLQIHLLTYLLIPTDRQTDHAMVTSDAIGETAVSNAA